MTKQAEKATKEAAAEAKKAAKLASASALKLKLLTEARKQVVVDATGDSRKGISRSVKLVPVKTTHTRTVRMPQCFKKTS